ncbi:MAG TPA: hypothetical protein VNO20_00960 [Solirubrobacterales bacterium]|nr:hypothetical protein [Solirubrobacterales bacterium]
MQLEFAGRLAVADGRYLARDEGPDGAQRVLVVETLGAPPPPGRRRRKPRPADADDRPSLPLVRVTAIRAFEPFDLDAEAEAWVGEAVATDETLDAAVAEGVALLNRALHAQASASADPYVGELTAERSVAVRIGYGSGDQVAAGRFTVAHDVDVWARGGGRRRQRAEDLHPQERMAAILGRREQADACETLLLRTRADLDAGRVREAAFQLRVGLEALLAELSGALTDPGHEKDMAELEARRKEAGEAANAALRGELGSEQQRSIRELTEISERVLRRRRVLRG